jgi:glycine cleavage system regulatory protein
MSNITNTPIIQNLIINLIGIEQFKSLTPLFKLINEYGGNVITSRISQLGEHFSGLLLIDGHWDTITRIEQAIVELQDNLKLKILVQRTKSEFNYELNTPSSELKDNNEITELTEYLPYKISINNLDEPGLLEKITEFFVLQEVLIQDLYTTSYTAEYNADMVQVDIKIKIPSEVHIPSLREQFEVLCYNENLDASLSPYKII